MSDNLLYQTLYGEVASKLTRPDAVVVLDEVLATARSKMAVLSTIKAVADGMTRPGYGWYKTTEGLMELAATAREFSDKMLRRFVEAVPDPQDEKRMACAARWNEIIETYALDTVRTRDEAVAAFRHACKDKVFAYNRDEDAWLQLSKIQPTKLKGMNEDERLEWIEPRLIFLGDVFPNHTKATDRP